MQGRALTAKYDGYASCPLLVGDGKAILAEFIYGGIPQEVRLAPRIRCFWHSCSPQTFARFVDQSQPWRAFYHLKKDFFPGARLNTIFDSSIALMRGTLTICGRSLLEISLLRSLVRHFGTSSPFILV
jgi:hypothetical protein